MLHFKKYILILLLMSMGIVNVHAQNDTNAIKAIFVKALDFQDFNNDSAMYYAREGFILSKKANYKPGLGMAFMRFGALMNAEGKSDSALIYFQQALSIRRELHNIKGMAAIYQQISYVQRNLGRKDSSFYYMFQALRQYDKLNDSLGIAKIYVELANLFSTYENYPQAFAYLEKAQPIFVNTNDPVLLYQLYVEFGTLYFKQSKNKEALFYYLKARKCNEEIQNPVYEANNNNHIGLCYDELGDKKQALNFFQKSLLGYNDLDMPHEIAMLHFNIGNLYVNIGEELKGIIELKKSLDLAQQLNDQSRVLRCYEILSDAYAQKGDYFQAYQNYQSYAHLSDSLLNSEKISEIANMQVQYDTENKVQQIKLLDAENKSKETQSRLMFVFIIAITLAAAFIGITLLQRSKLAHKKEQLALQEIKTLLTEQEAKSYDAMLVGQEEERKRIANDLHDRLGSMLSTVKLLFSSLDVKIEGMMGENKLQYHKANNLLDNACDEVRRISHNLSTGMVSTFGLKAALEDLSDGINSSGRITCKLLIYGIDERMEDSIEIALYRITQEIIQNILKHAEASSIIIQINRLEGSICLTIEDNGKGFNVEEKKNSGGLGLASIEARAKKLNGVYNIDSSIGRGTISIVEIPLNTTT